MSLEDLKAKLEECKGTTVSILSDSDICKQSLWLTTPSYDLNRILSGDLTKAFPNRCLMYIVGPETSFKSSFMALCLANAQKEGFLPVIIDSEGAWTDKFAQRWGLDTQNSIHVYEPFVDNVCVLLTKILSSNNEKMAIIIDSIGGLETEKLIEDGMRGEIKADQGQLQKKIKRMLKLLLAICKKKNSFAIYSGHFFGNPNAGMYSSGEEIGGGKFAKLAPDIIISLKKSHIKTADREIIGNEIRAITLKNRFYPPFNEGIVRIDYINGLDRFAGLGDLAIEIGMISRKGSWYEYDTKKMQGQDGITKLISEHEEDFIKKINEWISKTHYSTVNVEIKSIVEMEEEQSNERSIGSS